MEIMVETTVDAPLADVWRGWTSPEDIRQWNAASDDWHTTEVTLDLRDGGAFLYRMEAKDGSAGFDFAGTYSRVVEAELIEADFGGRALRTTFRETPEGVHVVETFDAGDDHSVEAQRAGWQAILDNFKRHMEAEA